MSLTDYVRATSAAAAWAFNIYPRKGRVAPGSDADVAVIDPEGTTVASAKTHHSNIDTNVYEGRRMRGRVTHTISRGRVVWAEGVLDVKPGTGRFVPMARDATPSFVPARAVPAGRLGVSRRAVSLSRRPSAKCLSACPLPVRRCISHHPGAVRSSVRWAEQSGQRRGGRHRSRGVSGAADGRWGVERQCSGRDGGGAEEEGWRRRSSNREQNEGGRRQSCWRAKRTLGKGGSMSVRGRRSRVWTGHVTSGSHQSSASSPWHPLLRPARRRPNAHRPSPLYCSHIHS